MPAGESPRTDRAADAARQPRTPAQAQTQAPPSPLPLPQAVSVAVGEESPAPAFGGAFTGHMSTARWTEEEGWQSPVLSRRGPLAVDPAMAALHYGQIVIEGLKAHRQVDGSVAVFRPRAHARRMQQSARRLAMPEPPEELFLAAVEQVTGRDQEWLPRGRADVSLYLRPVLFATEPSLALRPARSHLFLVLAFVTGGFFCDRPEPIAVTTSEQYVRAAPGGTGAAKCAGNYAPTYLAQLDAAASGHQQVLWLDAVRREAVEELGGMNVFLVERSGTEVTLTTPPLDGTLLPGVTRDALLRLAPALGHRVGERPVTVAEWREGCRRGVITEAFACGTAAVVTPIGKVRAGTGTWRVGDGTAGPVTLALHAALRDVQRGTAPDRFGWLHPVRQRVPERPSSTANESGECFDGGPDRRRTAV